MLSRLRNWWRMFMLRRRVRKLAANGMRDNWEKVRVKTMKLPAAQVPAYVGKYSATAIHQQVDCLMRNSSIVDSQAANLLIVKATEMLNYRLLRRLQKERRVA